MASIFSILSLDVWHKYFFFLSTELGIFYKTTAEVIIFLLLSYMAISEYLRTDEPDRKKELGYLIIAFVSFLFNGLIQAVIYANILFGDYNFSVVNIFWPVLDRMTDLISIALLVHAFVYPIFTSRQERYKIELGFQLYLIVGMSIIINIAWILEGFKEEFLDFWGNTVYVMMMFIIISYALYVLVAHSTKNFRYRFNIFIAFWLYLMVPVLQSMNIILFENDSIRLRLLEQPFPIFAILLLTQVTYLKLVDKAHLRKKLFEAEKKYQVEKEMGEMKDEFVSVVSHELRTPLTSMKLYLSLLNDEKFGAVSEKQKNAIGIIKSESDRLSNLINDILHLSKLEGKKDELNLERFKLAELENPIYFANAREKSINLEFHLPPGATVNVDVQRFKQVFINLMSNAIKFTPENGHITVEYEEAEDEWMFSIADNGKGIPKDEIPRLFDKFYQVESHMTRTAGGTGLGLAIVKKIVDMHKGRIEVESEVGQGSKFIVHIPKKIWNK